MGKFSDILITADFDRTLTAPDSTVPQPNLEAIRYFMENGGAFTLNTGRSLAMCRSFLDQVPVNAPLLLFNGSVAYDLQKEEFVFCHTIDINLPEMARHMLKHWENLVVEVQGLDAHYTFEHHPLWREFYITNRCPAQVVALDEYSGPFIKMCIYGPLRDTTVSHLFAGTAEEIALYDRVEADLKERYGDSISVLRASKRMVDVQACGISKGNAARELLNRMGRKILICIGDEANDLSMLEEADYAYCPADGALADRFENVCNCADGAVAEVIYKKIPEILEKMP